MTYPVHRREGLVVGVAALLASLPVALARMAPSADLGQHELMVAAMRDFGDPVRFPASVYQLSLGNANQLFFLVAWPLSYVVPVDALCRALLALLVAAVPLLAARAAHHAGRSPLVGAALAPLALGFAFRWSLISYLLGFVLFLGAMPALDRLAREPSPKAAARAALWAVALALAHGSAAFLLATLTAATLVTARRPWRAWALIAAPATVSLAVFGASFLRFQSQVVRETSTPGGYGIALAARPGLLLWSLYGPLDPWAHLAVPALLALGLVALARTSPTDGTPRIDRRLGLTAALCLAQFFAWPSELGGAGLVFHRFALFAAALFALSVRTTQRPLTALRGAVAMAGLAAMLVALGPLMRIVDGAWRDLDRVIARVEPGSAIAELDLVEVPYTLHVYGAAVARVVALRGGVTQNDFTIAPQYPVHRHPRAAWYRTRERLFWPQSFMPAADFRRFRYALVRRSRRHDTAVLDRAMAPEGRLVAHEGRWSLYESTLARLPLDASEVPLPTPAPETLRQRIAAMGRPFVFPAPAGR